MDVLVFRTSISEAHEVSKVKPLLTAVGAIKQWSFDLEDCDNILRIETNGLQASFIELLLQNAGYKCIALD